MLCAIVDPGGGLGITSRPKRFDLLSNEVRDNGFVDAVRALPDVAEAAGVTAVAECELFERHATLLDLAKYPLRGPVDGTHDYDS